jgi:methylmalonyl-CoA mutase, N-terminal domain
MIAAIESGFIRREIAEAAFAYQRDVDASRKLIVGVNAFVEPDEKPIDMHKSDDQAEREQIASLRQVIERRGKSEWQRSLDELRLAASANRNLLPPLLNAARCRATVGEIMSALAEVFGRYESSVV